jgi:hypothetical protein
VERWEMALTLARTAGLSPLGVQLACNMYDDWSSRRA